MSKPSAKNETPATETKKSGRPALQEQSVQVVLTDKKVKIVRRTNQVIEVINQGKVITLPDNAKAKAARVRLEKLDSKKDKAKVKELKALIAAQTVKFKKGDVMVGQAKSVLKQAVTEKELDIDVDKYNTRSLGKNVIAALQD